MALDGPEGVEKIAARAAQGAGAAGRPRPTLRHCWTALCTASPGFNLALSLSLQRIVGHARAHNLKATTALINLKNDLDSVPYRVASYEDAESVLRTRTRNLRP